MKFTDLKFTKKQLEEQAEFDPLTTKIVFKGTFDQGIAWLKTQ